MAVKANKVKECAPGKFYVDDQCIDCDLCRDLAPEFFGRLDDKCCSFVKKQPANAQEEELCMEALESCPVDAIGNDGDE